MLGEAAARGRHVALRDKWVKVRDGHTGPREAGTIGFATLRGGNVIGDHMVILAGQSERIELNHRAQDRTIYANGAIRALLWAAQQPAGLYSMVDVLGLN
jgi:4-hydroxy-tetrahydrodipicolinate reductase